MQRLPGHKQFAWEKGLTILPWVMTSSFPGWGPQGCRRHLSGSSVRFHAHKSRRRARGGHCPSSRLGKQGMGSWGLGVQVGSGHCTARMPRAHPSPGYRVAAAGSSRRGIAHLKHSVLPFARRRLPPRWLRARGSPVLSPSPSLARLSAQ